MKKVHALIATGALLAGIATTMAVGAAQYNEVGTVAGGVYLVHGDESGIRIEAADDVQALVYSLSGDIVLAREIGAGSARTFLLSDGAAVVALFGGAATIGSKGAADVVELGVKEHKFAVIQDHTGPVDEDYTAEIPPMLVGIGGRVQGSALGLDILATTDKGTVFHVTDAGFETLDESLTVEALQAGVIDVHVAARQFNGTLWLNLHVPMMPEIVVDDIGTVSVEVEDKAPEVPASMPINETEYLPVRFALDDDATLVFDVAGGYMLDASLYDGAGAQLEYIHRGADLQDARGWCRDVTNCFWMGGEYPEVEEETIEIPLSSGEYLLFVRAAWVDGNMTLVDSHGTPILDALEVLETEYVEVTDSTELELVGPVLDVWAYDGGLDAFSNVNVTINEASVYEYSATVSLFGAGLFSEERYNPANLGAGLVVVTREGLTKTATWESGVLSIVTVKL